VQLIMTVIPATKWAEITWFKFWLYYTLPYSLIIGLITTVWFTWGSTRDLIRLFRRKGTDHDAGGAVSNGLAGFLGFLGGFRKLLSVLPEFLHFVLERIQISAFGLHLGENLRFPGLNFLDCLVLHSFFLLKMIPQ
jgi:hypothetical protein